MTKSRLHETLLSTACNARKNIFTLSRIVSLGVLCCYKFCYLGFNVCIIRSKENTTKRTDTNFCLEEKREQDDSIIPLSDQEVAHVLCKKMSHDHGYIYNNTINNHSSPLLKGTTAIAIPSLFGLIIFVVHQS